MHPECGGLNGNEKGMRAAKNAATGIFDWQEAGDVPFQDLMELAHRRSQPRMDPDEWDDPPIGDSHLFW